MGETDGRISTSGRKMVSYMYEWCNEVNPDHFSFSFQWYFTIGQFKLKAKYRPYLIPFIKYSSDVTLKQPGCPVVSNVFFIR